MSTKLPALRTKIEAESEIVNQGKDFSTPLITPKKEADLVWQQTTASSLSAITSQHSSNLVGGGLFHMNDLLNVPTDVRTADQAIEEESKIVTLSEMVDMALKPNPNKKTKAEGKEVCWAAARSKATQQSQPGQQSTLNSTAKSALVEEHDKSTTRVKLN